jgi:5-methylcytosine-specific restriction endonuclease McrA
MYERLKNRRKRYKKEVKKLAVEYKGGKCVLCGLTDDCYEVYDFHHRDPAQKDVSISVLIKKLQCSTLTDPLKLELDKCDMLCSNCHRRVHFEQKA